MGALAVMSGKDLVSDVTSLAKLDAQNISFKTSGQDTADLASGKCTEGNEVGCFTAGTVVKTADGEKNVEEVNTGDYVLSEDPETGEQEYKEVVHTFIHVKWKLVHNICKKAKKFYRWLNSGKTDYQVYFGVKHDGYVYTGIIKQDLEDRLAQHNRPRKTKTGEVLPGKDLDDLDLVYEGLTRNQARAIEQYMIEYGPNRLNKINSISPKFNKHYNRARAWAEEYLKTHINEYTKIYMEGILK